MIISIDKHGRKHFIFKPLVFIGWVPKCTCLSFLRDFVEESPIGQFIMHSCWPLTRPLTKHC